MPYVKGDLSPQVVDGWDDSVTFCLPILSAGEQNPLTFIQDLVRNYQVGALPEPQDFLAGHLLEAFVMPWLCYLLRIPIDG